MIPKRELRLIDVIQLPENERLVYELIPNSVGILYGARIELNERGYRGLLYPYEKPEGIFRIISLGDSTAFGFGVDVRDTYMFLLEQLINEAGFPWEVINIAVPSYNTSMEVEKLVSEGLKYEPDLVVLSFHLNDFGLPHYLRMGGNFLTLRRSFLYDWLIQYRPLIGGFEPVRKLMEPDMELIPPKYRYMVGQEGVVNALRRLKRVTQERNIPVVIEYYRDDYNGVPDKEKYSGNDLQPFFLRVSVLSWAFITAIALESYTITRLSRKNLFAKASG